MDLASLSGMSKFSGGQIQYFPGYHSEMNKPQCARFDAALKRYLTRKIGFEAVMRIRYVINTKYIKTNYHIQKVVTRISAFLNYVYFYRCTRGLNLHTFHGNFFVRSTDLLSLPNVNPDAGFGMQVSIEGKLIST